MKLPQHPIIALILATLLSGCANSELRRSVHTVSVDGNVTNRHKGFYRSGATDTIGVLGVVGIGLIPAMGIQAGIAAGPKNDMAKAATSGSESLEKIVADAFTAEIPQSGALTLAKPGPGDATFQLEIDRFGLDHHRSLLIIHARLMKGSVCLFECDHQGRSPKTSHYNIDDVKTHPEIFMAGWKLAAADAAHQTLADLTDEFDLGKLPAAAPAPAPAPPRAPAPRH